MYQNDQLMDVQEVKDDGMISPYYFNPDDVARIAFGPSQLSDSGFRQSKFHLIYHLWLELIHTLLSFQTT